MPREGRERGWCAPARALCVWRHRRRSGSSARPTCPPYLRSPAHATPCRPAIVSRPATRAKETTEPGRSSDGRPCSGNGEEKEGRAATRHGEARVQRVQRRQELRREAAVDVHGPRARVVRRRRDETRHARPPHISSRRRSRRRRRRSRRRRRRRLQAARRGRRWRPVAAPGALEQREAVGDRGRRLAPVRRARGVAH